MTSIFQNYEVIVVSGDEAPHAADGIYADLAREGLHPTIFGNCAWVPEAKLIEVMRHTARITGAPTILWLWRNHGRELIELADLHVVAPGDVGHRVWFIDRKTGHSAFSICVPCPAKRTRTPRPWSDAAAVLMATHPSPEAVQ